MKRIYRTCIASVLALSLLTGGVVSASAGSGTAPAAVFAAEEENCIPGAEMHYAVMTVSESLEGTASILSVSDGFANASAQ